MLFTFVRCLRQDLPADAVLGSWIAQVRAEAARVDPSDDVDTIRVVWPSSHALTIEIDPVEGPTDDRC